MHIKQEYEEARNILDSKKKERKKSAAELKQLQSDYRPIEEKLGVQKDALKMFKETQIEANQKRRQLLRK